MRLVSTVAAMNIVAHAAYVHAGPAMYKSPPMAGPMMMAVCVAVALDATARGSRREGISAGSIACSVGVSNARDAPTTNTSAKIACSVIHPMTLPAANTEATSASTNWQTRAMRRRS
jgi:hypothetical protein